MAVTRVYGRVDGTDIILQQTTGGRWEIPVPYDADGQYVVEIIAEDEAGNQSYLAKMLWTVNTSLLCAHLEPVPYYAELLPDRYSIEYVGQGLVTQLCVGQQCVEVVPDRWWAEVVEPQCSQKGGRYATD